MVKTIEATGNTLNDAWQKINKKMIEIAEKETIIFRDLRKHGNYELGFKMVFEYQTPDLVFNTYEEAQEAAFHEQLP